MTLAYCFPAEFADAQLLPVQEKGGSPVIAQIEFRLHRLRPELLILVNVMIADEKQRSLGSSFIPHFFFSRFGVAIFVSIVTPL